MATKALNYTTAEINQRLNLAGTAVQPSALNDYYTKTEVDGKVVVDLSTRYNTSYANLSAALTALNNDTSTDAAAIKKGGVSVKFINSTTNKYEQWNLKASSWSTNTSDWALDVDGSVANGKIKLSAELVKPSSNKYVTQASEIGMNGQPMNEVVPQTANTSSSADLEISDENGNVLVRFKNGHIRTKEFNSENITPTNDHVLKNKKVAFIGDSITQGFYASPLEAKRYTTIFQQITGSIVTNLGVASTCLANNTLNNMSSQRFVTRATAANLADKDCIFVFGGTNDFSYDCKAIGNHFSEEPITGGTYIGTKKKAAISDTDTFAGALHELILQIRSVAPTARLIFITPLSRGRYSAGRPTCAECNQWGDYMQDFIDAIKDICYFYSIPVIDLYTLFNQDWQNDISGSMSSMDSDGIHPNNAGHERIAKILAKWCESNLVV